MACAEHEQEKVCNPTCASSRLASSVFSALLGIALRAILTATRSISSVSTSAQVVGPSVCRPRRSVLLPVCSTNQTESVAMVLTLPAEPCDARQNTAQWSTAHCDELSQVAMAL
jgi:hypothetical protein